MNVPENWDMMSQEEKEKWMYDNATPSARHYKHVKEASVKLVDIILNDEDLSKIKITEIEDVLKRTERLLFLCYGQLSLRQASKNIDDLPENELSYSDTQFPR